MNSITKPTLLLDEQRCRENISAMAKKAQDSNVVFRPHFKTHQSREVANWYIDSGVKCITVSSIDMAEYFSTLFEHITIAIPTNRHQVNQLNQLLKTDRIAILLDNASSASTLAANIVGNIDCWIEIDTGSKRTGLDPSDVDGIRSILEIIESSSNLSFMGFYSHPGHTYNSNGKQEIMRVYDAALTDMLAVKDAFASKLPFEINIGDTPGCSTAKDFSQIDSISPGNFVFYDVTQSVIGSCDEGAISVCMACPIISKNESRQELVIYGGGIHFSKDRFTENGVTHFGKMVELSDSGWGSSLQDCYLRSISQEHGVVKVDPETFKNYNIGDIIGILPIHSCMTADCMGHYSQFSGELVDHMRRTR